MSIQERAIRHDPPEQISLSSKVEYRGSDDYNPFYADNDDDEENEQSTNSTQESLRINNGATINPVMTKTNATSSSDKSSNEQSTQRQSESPREYHSRYSDRRSRSPHHSSSDRKRLRPSSPSSSASKLVTKTESSKLELIPSSTQRNSSRITSKSDLQDRSSSRSPSSSVPSTHNPNNGKSSDKAYSSKRDDNHSHRSNSSRSSHSYSSSKYSSRDPSSSTDRRTSNSRASSPSHQEQRSHSISTEDRHRTYSRLKNVNDTNTTRSPSNSSNKLSPAGSALTNTNGTSQRSRSNLIQIATIETTTSLSAEPLPVRSSSSKAKLESTVNLSVSDPTDSVNKSNGNTADHMLMEEMLREEEQEQTPVKVIDLNSVTIPDISTKKSDEKQDPIKIIAPANATPVVTPTPSLIPSLTRKPYTLYKVPHTNHTTPPLPSRHKKQTNKEPIITTQSDSTTTNKPSADDHLRRTSLDERISTILGAPPNRSSTEQSLETRSNPPTQTTSTSTPSDKSTESPQDVNLLVSTMIKKGHEQSPFSKKQHSGEERRSTTSKHYTSEWLATQKPEEAPTEELPTLPSLVTLPTLVSSQLSVTTGVNSSVTTEGDTSMLGKLTEAMNKLIQKQGDTGVPTTTTGTGEVEDAVPASAKHLERIERKKQRQNQQNEIAAIAKEALKPAFRRRSITKDEYKQIMKKVVTKATQANEVDRSRIGRMIDAYVERYRTLRQQNISKSSTTFNGNVS